MPDHVVYLLGAGFSAPLGLPVMADFVSRSKDQYARTGRRFAHFESVFNLFEKLAKVKNFYRTDLSNVEEILSILSIGDFEKAPDDKDQFVRYLCDVITYHTPEWTPYPHTLPANWRPFAFGQANLHNDYGNFLLALARRGLRYSDQSRDFSTTPPDESTPTYSVVTLNYDLVLETCHRFANRHLALAVPLAVDEPWVPETDYRISVSQLHGTVTDNQIVPPTWSKGFDTLPAAAWSTALTELGRANHLRIIGYSLPDSDLNVRYLLKAAALASFHLKSIDVICLDPGETVRERYDSFIDHPGYRFQARDISRYLSGVTLRAGQQPTGNCSSLLEESHSDFMALAAG